MACPGEGRGMQPDKFCFHLAHGGSGSILPQHTARCVIEETTRGRRCPDGGRCAHPVIQTIIAVGTASAPARL
jgi:hypothetical protein